MSCAPRDKDFRLTTLNTAKPNPANAANKIPRGLNESTPLAVPTKMIPTTVTEVPTYQLLPGISPRTT